MSDRIIAAIALGILAGSFLWQGQPASAAAVVVLLLVYLWKGRP